MPSRTQRGPRLRGYFTTPAAGAETVSVKDPAARKTTAVDVAPAAKRYLHRICPALPYAVRLSDGDLSAWVPDLSSERELGRFLTYCGYPATPKSFLGRIDLAAFVANPATALDQAALTPDIADRIARWLPPGFVALAKRLVELDASARDIYQIHAALVMLDVAPEQYLTWLKTHAFDLLESEAVDAGFALLDQLTAGCSTTTRIAGAVMAVVAGREKYGHTATLWSQVLRQAAKLLRCDKQIVHDYLRDQCAKEPRSPRKFWVISVPSTTPGEKATAYVAREPTSLCERNASWGIVDQQARRVTQRLRVDIAGPLAPDQEAVISAIRKHRLVVVTGAAGTGKTHLVRMVGDAVTAAGKDVAWTATTGRAARVLHPSGTTLHAFLGIRPGAARHHDARPVDMLVVDEASMLDTWLAGPLGSYLTDGRAQRVVIIGDPYQLPPVSAGKVLADLSALAGGCLVRSQVPELTTIRRTDAGGILSVANAIRERQPLPDLTATPGVSVYPANKSALAKVVALAGGHPANTLVVAPVHDGPLGVRALNAALRDAHLGPSDDLWLEGMRVIQRKTSKVGDPDEPTIIPNGTFGTVARITTDAITVAYEDGVEVSWEHKQCASEDGVLAPAYALTVHKAQGSQASHVIVVAAPGSTRSWRDPAMGYTAVTRAIDDLVIVGDPDLLRGDPTVAVTERTTMLVPRMLQYITRSQLMKEAS